MDDNQKMLWIIGIIFFLYQTFQNIKKIKEGNEEEKDHYDEDSGMWFDQKGGLVVNLIIVFALIIGYILINYFGFK